MPDANDPNRLADLDQTGGERILPSGGEWPSDPPGGIEQDVRVLAWLQGSPQLSIEATGYLCDALVLWVLLGHEWPDPAAPVAGPDCDHFEEVVQITERWMRRALTEPIGPRLELARVGRALGSAIDCQRPC